MAKKLLALFLVLVCSFNININVFANDKENIVNKLDLLSKSAILMEAKTGKVLYELNPDEKLSPASVTKVMTLYLIYDSVDKGKIKWDDIVTVSEYASSMGGSQIFLEPMEKQDVKTLTKSIAIASANDAAVAMAEFIAGSEKNFVNLMNETAKALGMENTNFENACGLDTDTKEHYMSARDIAIISRELMTKFPEIKEFTTKWQDTITHKTKKGETEFGLTNTNKLLKMYDGITGLKTGSTQKALYCLSATAEKNDLSLVAVVMASPEPKERFKEVIKMFDYGFSNYEVVNVSKANEKIGEVNVYKGKNNKVEGVLSKDANFVIKKGEDKNIQTKVEMLETIKAPIKKGIKIGEVIYSSNGNEIGRIDVISNNEVEKAGFNDIIKNLIIDWVI